MVMDCDFETDVTCLFFFSADKPVSSGILKMLRVMMWSFSRGPGNPRETGGDWKFGTRVSDVGQQDFHDDSPDFGYVDVWYGIYVCNVFIYIYLLYDVHWRSVYRYITQCVYNCDVAYFFLGQMHMCMATYVFLQCAPLLQWLRGMPKQVKVCVLDGPPSRPPRTRITSRKKLRKNCAGSDGVCG